MITTKPIINFPLQHLRIYRIIAVVVIIMFAIGGLSNTAQATERTLYVNSTDDEGDPWPGDGDCDTLSPAGECTLRAALDEVNGLYQGFYGAPDTDVQTIVVPAGTYNLTNPSGGLGAGFNLVIEGAGRDLTIIDGNNSVGVLSIPSGATVEISALTITNGEDASGAGIYNQGNLVLTDVAVSNNYADVGSGGGIYNGDQMTLIRVVISGNDAEQSGGGIYNHPSGVLNITDTTLYRNKSLDTTGIYDGGGINNSGVMTVEHTTFDGNSAPTGGANVTISNNNATTTGTAGGGAIRNESSASLTLRNVTITDNTTTTGAAFYNGGVISVAHTIIANNTVINCDLGLSGPTVPVSHHNIDSGSTCNFYDGSVLYNTDPLLEPLAQNGGLTETHALGMGSPAIDAGGICMSGGALLLTDQRGWPRTVDGDVNGTATCDLGAFEAPPPYQLWLPLIMR